MPRTVITTPRVVSRFMGGSTLFNGTTSTINCGATDIIGTGAATVSAWIRPISLGGASVGRILDNGKFILQLIAPNKLNFRSDGGAINAVSFDSSIQFAKWSHILVSRNAAGQTTFYINGVINGSANQASGTPAAASSNTFIGNNTNANRSFDGKIAEVKIFNSALTADQAQELYTTGLVSGVTPVASYALDDLPPTYIDSVAGNNGTGTATTYSPDTPIQQRVVVSDDKASLSFDGTDDKVEFGNDKVGITNAVSIRAKFKRNGVGSSTRIINLHNRCSLNMDSNQVRFTLYGIWDGTSFFIPDNQYVDVVATYDKVNYKLYINGKLVVVQAKTDNFPTAGSETLQFGVYSAGNWFKGTIKEAQVWKDVALTHEEVKAMAFNGTIPYANDQTVLKLNTKLNEGAGTIAYDSSGNGNNGTITGATWSAETPSKARTVVGGNLVKNGDFEYAPPFIAETTTSGRWVDGTPGGSTTNDLFKIATYLEYGAKVKFDSSDTIRTTALTVESTASAPTANHQVGVSNVFNAAPTLLTIKNWYALEASVQYTFSFLMKTVGVSSVNSKGVIASIVGYKGDFTSNATIASLPGYISGTTEWKRYTITFTPGEYRFVKWSIRIVGETGLFSLDDISLTKTIPDTRTTV